MATYTTSTTLSGLQAYVLTLTLTEKSNSKGSVTVDYSLVLTSKNGYHFSGVALGWKVVLGGTTLAYQARSGHQMSLGSNTSTTLVSGSKTVSQGANLAVSAIIDSATTTYSPGPMNITGKFSTSMVYKLTVNYWSNYATEMSGKTPLNPVGPDKNVLVFTDTCYSNEEYRYGLYNYTSFGLTRDKYKSTGYWGTSPDGGVLINQDTGFASGSDLAEAFGLDISSNDASVNIYAQWKRILNVAKLKVNGEFVEVALKVKNNGYWTDCIISKI